MARLSWTSVATVFVLVANSVVGADTPPPVATPAVDGAPLPDVGVVVDEPPYSAGPGYSCEPAVPCEVGCDTPFQPTGFGGPFWTRPKFTGDWDGCRDCLAEDGITFDVDSVMIYQGIASGGRRQRDAFGGHNDYVLTVDLGKLGVSQGTIFKVRGETQFGETINPDSGSLIVPASPFLFPVPNEDITAVTNFLFMQFLSEEFAVFAGKVDTIDGDKNAYAHGRGKSQFLGTSFIINPVAFRTVPYSTYAAGFLVLREDIELTFQVYDPEEYATRCDLDELFTEGVGIASEARIPVEVGGLPGHQAVGVTWSSRNYVSTQQDPRFLLGLIAGPANEVEDSWSAYYNFDQALIVDPCDPTRHWGVFGRYGYADPDASPLEHFISFGVGGASPLRHRPADTFGVGWYYASSSNNLPGLLLGDHGQGTELYYNVAVTPWFHLTADLQVLWPARNDVANVVIPGLRAVVDF